MINTVNGVVKVNVRAWKSD